MRHFTLQAVLVWAAALAWTASVATAQTLPNMRIMPLGDSITSGSGSSDNNGYRKRLRDKLLANGAGVSVDMIGSRRNGSMPDNNHQGHSGEYLRGISTFWQQSIAARPNVVLVHAGTNNMDKEVDLDVAPALMEKLIDGVFGKAPDAVVLVAPIIWANDARMQANTDAFNKKLQVIISDRQGAGKHILSVPITITINDLKDTKHPDDGGYEKMAAAWYSGIVSANNRGWLKSPVSVSATGVGLGCTGGKYESLGPIAGPVPSGRRDKVILADLNGDGRDDFLMADDSGAVRAWVNNGSPTSWTNLQGVNPPWSNVKGSMVRMADVDGDGKADMIVLASDGSAKVWKNTDNGRKFTALDAAWAPALVSSDKVRFVDMNGDGYADYVILYSDGAMKWAQNTKNNGKDKSKANFAALKTIATGPAGIPANSVRLSDLDGDGKAGKSRVCAPTFFAVSNVFSPSRLSHRLQRRYC